MSVIVFNLSLGRLLTIASICDAKHTKLRLFRHCAENVENYVKRLEGETRKREKDKKSTV